MANKILVARGTKARIEEIKSTLATNELVYSTDTGELGVKKADGNIEYFMNAADIDAIVNTLETSKQDKLVAGENITIEDNVISASGGGEVDPNEMAYFNYASSFYGDNYSLLANAWQDMKNSEKVLFDIPLMLAAPNQDMGQGIIADLYVGTDGQLQALYDACANETIPPPIDSLTRDVYYVNNVATYYMGDISGDVGFPIPLYMFGYFSIDDSVSFIIGDLTPLGMGLGLALAKIANVSIPNNNIVIQQGFEFENESGIIIPNSVTSIGAFAFQNWSANNLPLVIPNSVTSIDNSAFAFWQSNNQPLVIPNSVTSIGSSAFYGWSSNNQPLVIPNSVTSIGDSALGDWSANNQPLIIPNSVTEIGNYAFGGWSLVPYVEIRATTPPTLADANAFANQNDAPIYVPDESVDDYKTATNWVVLADRIFSINDK